MKGPINLESLSLDRLSGEPLGAQLVRRLRGAIESGFFAPSSRLLSSRELAKRLSVSRNTVTSALEQLTAEGYLEARVGAGTFVCEALAPIRSRAVATTRPLPKGALTLSSIKSELDALGSTSGPLRLGAPDLSKFPLRTWQRLGRKSLAALDAYLDYGQSSGLLALREAISRHVAQFRGVAAESEQVVIVEGAQAAFHLIALALTSPGDAVAIEDPCYALARVAFHAQGLLLQAVPVDAAGLRTDALPPVATLAYVTPSHQFPLGGTLSLARRIDLLRWANHTNAYVIEDDYDSEFDSYPLPALQSLDREGRVIYVGTFSKSLAPGLRLGYVVVPPHLAETFRLARAISGLGASAYLQATAADFIAQGYFVRHVRRMSPIYQQRRNILIDALKAALPNGFTIGPAQGGLHLAITGPPDFDDRSLARSMPYGQRFLPLSLLCVDRTDVCGIVLGFGSGSDGEVERAATTLGKVLAARTPIVRAP